MTLRKLLAIAVIAIAVPAAKADDTGMKADPADKAVWRKGNYTALSFGWQQTALEYGSVDKSSFNISLIKGTSYLFPRKPILGIFKAGLDVRWFDLSVAKFKKSPLLIDGDMADIYPDPGDEYDDEIPNIGKWSLQLGMGIGPVITAAPFASSGSSIRSLKASVYFHYRPSLGAYFLSEDGETDASWAYCGMMDFGGKIQCKAIGIGVEGSWGKGKFKSLVDDFMDDGETNEDFATSSDKVTRKFATTRLYITFTF